MMSRLSRLWGSGPQTYGRNPHFLFLRYSRAKGFLTPYFNDNKIGLQVHRQIDFLCATEQEISLMIMSACYCVCRVTSLSQPLWMDIRG